MSDRISLFDVVVVGAGLAGLVCARQLQHQGLNVVVLDKSRGVGGRVATRRLHDTCADLGLPYFSVQGKQTQQLLDRLQENQIVRPWTGNIYQLDAQNWQLMPSVEPYIASIGINAIAKFLAQGLEVWREWRVTALNQTLERTWQIFSDEKAIAAKAVVVAIPAPQALMLLEASTLSLPSEFFDYLRAVEFDPCLSVIAGYDRESHSESWQAVRFLDDPQLAWAIWESSKRDNLKQPVLTFHSTAQFAQGYLDTSDLCTMVHKICDRAAQVLLPWLNNPQWYQVHRWRYAFVSRPLKMPCLATTTPLPLVCCGDWFEEDAIKSQKQEHRHLENALNSGMAAATELMQAINL
jgi:renalase